MTQARMNHSQLGIFFIDLDGFKEINDLKGHLSGDRLLQVLADRINSQPDFTNISCRWGGDEFIVFTEVIDKKHAIKIAESIQNLFIEPAKIDYDDLKVGATIGIAIYPDDSESAEELIHAADIAMYSQKRMARGGNCLYLPSMLFDIQQTQILKEGLSRVLDNNELTIVYQPIIDTNKEHPISFEALLRWKFNDMEISPEKFIPIAEDSGSIHEIGAWVLEKACYDATVWNKKLSTSVSINVSVKQLVKAGFLNIIDHALNSSGLEPEKLKIEITENVFAEDKKQIAQLLSSLRSRGIKVSIDDFGTGFSSLASLQAIPIDEIKIDRAFVKSIETTGSEIIKATLSIAAAFNCYVVAEGIENLDDKNKLKQLGVDRLQGFFYAKPMILEELLDNYIDSFITK